MSIDHNQLRVTGTAILDGTLELTRINNIVPAIGTSYTVLTYGSHVGEFALITGLDAGGGNVFVPNYGANGLTLTVATPLLAAGDAAEGVADVITAEQAQPTFSSAVAAWLSAADSAAVADRLSGVQFQVANLSGTTLAAAAGNTIWIDDNAAGLGWFLDATPWDDEEFTAECRGSLREPTLDRGAIHDNGAAYAVDLLTVVLHELGHVLDLDHDDDLDSLMSDVLATGVRRCVSSDEVDALFAAW